MYAWGKNHNDLTTCTNDTTPGDIDVLVANKETSNLMTRELGQCIHFIETLEELCLMDDTECPTTHCFRSFIRIIDYADHHHAAEITQTGRFPSAILRPRTI